MLHKYCYSSPLGPIHIEVNNNDITKLTFISKTFLNDTQTPLFQKICTQLDEYFNGTRQTFEVLQLKPTGTPFQQTVWQELLNIPYGQTCCYQTIAIAIHKPKSARAVGQAIHCNPIAILIPCHRIIGKSGHLTGYAAGLQRKAYLLQLEETHKLITKISE